MRFGENKYTQQVSGGGLPWTAYLVAAAAAAAAAVNRLYTLPYVSFESVSDSLYKEIKKNFYI